MPKILKRQRKESLQKKGLMGWLRRHKLDVAIVTCLVLIGGTVSAVNMTDYPQRFEDEGTYVSQSWAIVERGTLAHYTYWYDHPPAGWMQIAGYFFMTDALDRYDSAISAGREFMLLLHIATIGLMYALARRLRIHHIAAAIGVLAYALSPLAVEFSRYVLLDNVALPWLLAAFLLALSPRRHIAPAIGSAICMAIAVLSKETFIIMLPILLYALWRSSDSRNRRYIITSFSVIFVMIGSIYVLYATLKNELIPGEGHVSLIGTFFWQLFGREGSGSILEASSSARGLAGYWLSLDHWLLLAGLVALPFALVARNLRVIGLALLIGFVLLLRTGYLPYPYVIILLPFAALVLAGVVDIIIRALNNRQLIVPRIAASMTALLLLLVTVQFITPNWHSKLASATTVDQDTSSREAVNWIDRNISRTNRLVVESALWTDLQNKGFNQPDPVWLYKTETDPAVKDELGTWKSIDYVILNGPTIGAKDFSKSFPMVSEAIKNSKVVAEFGKDNQKIVIFKVQK